MEWYWLIYDGTGSVDGSSMQLVIGGTGSIEGGSSWSLVVLGQ